MLNRSQYTYATGLIRALEPKLLDRTDLERMIDAKNIEEAFKVFNDTDYADNLLDVQAEEFEKALDDDLQQTKDLFDKIVRGKDLLRFLFLEYDFHNIKTLFKARFLEKDLDELLFSLGTQNLEFLKKYILKQEKEVINNFELEGKLDSEIKEIIDQAMTEFNENPHPHRIDAFLDRKYFELLKDLANKLNNQFINELVNFQIDLANLKIFLRARKLEKGKTDIQDQFISGGHIILKELLAYYDQSLEDFFKFFAKHYNDKRVWQALEEYLKDEKLWLLEKNLEDAKLEHLRKAKYVSFGPEVAVSFFYAKKNANSNVRSIMKGKLNEINREETRKRLREVY